MDRLELLARIREVGGIQGTERAEAVLQAVLDALGWEGARASVRPGPPCRLGADPSTSAEGLSDLCEREEMLCEDQRFEEEESAAH